MGDATERVVDHRDAAHTGGTVGGVLEVTDQAAVEHQPADRTLHDPPLRYHGEPFGLGIACHLGDDDVELGAVGRQRVLVAAIDQGGGYGRERGVDGVQEFAPAVGVGDVRAGDQDGEQQTQDVDGDVPLAAGQLLVSVSALVG